MINREEYTIASFYRFKKIENLKSIKKTLETFICDKLIRGTIIIAKEGCNGTISGKKNEIEKSLKFVKKILKIRKISLKINNINFLPFNRIKIRIKREIVSLGVKNINVSDYAGNYINPKSWEKFIRRKDVKLIDTRNIYEIPIGKFGNSIHPNTNSFREFPKKFVKLKINKNQKIAMYCTGGIRCEKASAYLFSLGYKKIYQLEGGILNYFNSYKDLELKSAWKGECFVFDNRVSIKKNFICGNYIQCYGCRRPLTKKDAKSKKYLKGVHCSYCYNERTKKQKEGSVMRQKQIDILNKKGLNHNFKKI